MSTKVKCILFAILALILIAGILFFCWLHVDGKHLPLPEGSDITGYVTVLQIGIDKDTGNATHDSVSCDMTNAQVADFLQLLRRSSYWRTGHGSSVSFDGDTAYTISLAYRDQNRTEIMMFSILDSGLISCTDSFGYLRIADSDFLTQLQAILDA